MRVPEKKEPTEIEKAQAEEGYYPTGWWVATEANSDVVLAESSNPNDWVFKDLRRDPDVVIHRVYEKKEYRMVAERPSED